MTFCCKKFSQKIYTNLTKKEIIETIWTIFFVCLLTDHWWKSQQFAQKLLKTVVTSFSLPYILHAESKLLSYLWLCLTVRINRHFLHLVSQPEKNSESSTQAYFIPCVSIFNLYLNSDNFCRALLAPLCSLHRLLIVVNKLHFFFRCFSVNESCLHEEVSWDNLHGLQNGGVDERDIIALGSEVASQIIFLLRHWRTR